MNPWYYSEAGQQRGPIPREDLQSKLAAGTLEPGALVWSEGMTDWQPASSVTELQPPAPQAAPPPISGSPFTPPAAVSPYAPPAAAPASEVDWSGHVPSGPQVRPWVRYWARTFDYLGFCLVVGGIASLAIPAFDEMNDTMAGVVLLCAYSLFEPILFALFGTTPFKALLRVRVRNKDGSKLSFFQALRRSLSVWVAGLGLGVPIVTLITNIYSFNRLTNQGITTWDQSDNLVVSHQPVTWWRWMLVLGMFVGFIALVIIGSQAE